MKMSGVPLLNGKLTSDGGQEEYEEYKAQPCVDTASSACGK